DSASVPVPFFAKSVPNSGAVTVSDPPPVTVMLATVSAPPVPGSRVQGLALLLVIVPMVRLPSSVTNAPDVKSRANPAVFTDPEGMTPPTQFDVFPQLPPPVTAGFQKLVCAG